MLPGGTREQEDRNLDLQVLKRSQLTAVGFIRVVLTVLVSVAPPHAVDALAVGTLELAAAARLLVPGLGPAGLRPLVGAVGAVGISVAAQRGQHALRVVALEGAAAACGRRAGGLVRAVQAVVVPIADVRPNDALAVGAAELGVFALFGR